MHTRRFVYRRKDDEVGRMMKWEGYEVEVRIKFRHTRPAENNPIFLKAGGFTGGLPRGR